MTRCLALFSLLVIPALGLAIEPAPAPGAGGLFALKDLAATAPEAIPAPVVPPIQVNGDMGSGCSNCGCACGCSDGGQRRLFESDRAFSRFIGPISNPVLSKDPRALTEARVLFVDDYIPDESPLKGGDFQV